MNFLVSIREDSLAKLDRFKGRIPNLFDNYLRVDQLDRDAARQAIERPLARFNEVRPPGSSTVSIEPALVDAVLDRSAPVGSCWARQAAVPSAPARGRQQSTALKRLICSW